MAKKNTNILTLGNSSETLGELLDTNKEILLGIQTLVTEQRLTNEYLKALTDINLNSGDICLA
jgi:hypothetical protein